MSRRLDDTDLQNLLDAAYGGTVHAVDVVRLVEEVKFFRNQMGNVECAKVLTDDRDDTTGRRAVGIEVLSVGFAGIEVPGLDRSKDVYAMRRDASVRAVLSQWEMFGGPLVDVLCTLVVSQWVQKNDVMKELLKRTQQSTTVTALWSEGTDPSPTIKASFANAARQIEKDCERVEVHDDINVFPQIAGFERKIVLTDKGLVEATYTETEDPQPTIVEGK